MRGQLKLVGLGNPAKGRGASRSVTPELLAAAVAAYYIVRCNPASWLHATEVE